NGTNAVTTGQLWTTDQALDAVSLNVTNLSGTVSTLGQTVDDHAVLIGANTANTATHATQISNLQTAAGASVRYDNANNKSVITLEGASGTRITNLANGIIAADSTDAVTG